jgi:hypothetical protein
MMKRNESEQDSLRQFADFVEANQITPSKEMDEAVLRIVTKDLRPAPWMIYSKLTLAGAVAGLATTTFCPQFGLGLGAHNEFLHTIHVATSPAVFYLLCGVLFVALGAFLGGFVLSRQEIRAISHSRNRYFAAYSVLAYVTLVLLGSEVFVAASLTWIVGALLGNVLCYGAVIHLRHT